MQGHLADIAPARASLKVVSKPAEEQQAPEVASKVAASFLKGEVGMHNVRLQLAGLLSKTPVSTVYAPNTSWKTHRHINTCGQVTCRAPQLHTTSLTIAVF